MTDSTDGDRPTPLEQLRREIDELDRRIVALLNERASKGREVGRVKAALGWTTARDPEREREVLLRVTIANAGPIPQEDLLAIYRRLIDATRGLEERDQARASAAPNGGEPAQDA
jgi:chorismate mutase/prephenate dehydratase